MSKISDPFGTSAVMLTRKSPVSWTFSQESRFKRKQKSLDVAYLVMPSTLSRRSTTMGLGSRWSPRNDKGHDSPPPGLYSLPSTLLTKGTVFSRKSSLPPVTLKKTTTPGPGSYNPNTILGNSSPKYTFRGNKAKITIPLTPAPGSYTPKNSFGDYSNAHKNLSFGIGNRKLSLKQNDNPGPGTYNARSDFQKFTLLH